MLIRSVIQISKCVNLMKTVRRPYFEPQWCVCACRFSMENVSSAPRIRPKKPEVPKITLITSADSILVTTMEEALKLSKRRDLKLVKIMDVDAKTKRPMYRLLTSAEYRVEEMKEREKRKQERENATVKGSKLLTVSSNISENDLHIKITKVKSWVSKKYEVNVSVVNEANNNQDKMEKVCKIMEEKLKDVCRFSPKRMKNNDIKFQIYPPKVAKKTKEDHVPS